VLLLFAYPAMYIVEKVFGFISDVTLIELSNTSGSLLRRMSQEVPGTFQHCIQVSNLAAEVAERIGAQVLLVRTGALYHDIGKMQNPAIYTENQKNGVNPLAAMDRKKAAKLIISHVAEGVRIAEREGLPSEIIDFIKTHHGVGLAKFFYINYRNEHADEEIDKGDFSYKGPKPQTKEQAILMMADAVEAASRSLRDFSEGSIGEMVNGIVDGQLQEGCFAEAPLNFRDITEAKLVMIERLSSINHTRIEYPKE
ncbi:MAG: HDIG domain-containing protein, partial [Bacteroidaceae bacterium]|nr:HDIG domain-containing protein [Bacteroidaceae bacterium]